MQNVLCIDTSLEPAEARILSVQGRNVKLLERATCDLKGLFDPENLARLETENVSESEETNASEATEDKTENETSEKESATNVLLELTESLKNSWTNSIVVLPPKDYHSLNIELPFTDPKNINKVLNLQVQDLVPFDLSEFVVQTPPITAKLANGNYDVHVNLMPKTYISNALKLCRSANLEPMIIATPGGILNSVYHLAPDYLSDNSAVVFERENSFYIVIAFDGVVRGDRLIRPANVTPGADSDEVLQNTLFTQLKLTIAAFERRYQRSLKNVYLINSKISSYKMQQVLGRAVEELSIAELIENADKDNDLVALGAIFLQDNAPPATLHNFRAGEFAYSLQLGELWRGLKQLLPHIILALLTVIIGATLLYLVRAANISSYENAFREEIKKVAPDINLIEGREIESLQGAIGSLNEQLRTFGSPTQYSPLDSLLEISEALPKTPGLEIREAEIRGNSVTLKGYGPSYQSIERIKVALRRKKSISSRIKDNIKKAGRNRYQFTFEIQLYE